MSVPLAPFLCSEAAATALGCWLSGWAWLKWVHCLWLCVWKRGWVGRGGGVEGMAQPWLGAREAAWGSGACRVHPTTPGKKVAKQTNWPAIRYHVTPAGLSVGCSITWPSSRGEMPACAVPPMGAAPPSPLQAAFRAHLSSSSVCGLFQQSSKAWLGSLRPGGKRGDRRTSSAAHPALPLPPCAERFCTRHNSSALFLGTALSLAGVTCMTRVSSDL